MTLVQQFLQEKAQHIFRGGKINDDALTPHKKPYHGSDTVGLWFTNDKNYAETFAEHEYDNDFVEADIDPENPLVAMFCGKAWDNGPYKPGTFGMKDWDGDGTISTDDVALTAYHNGNDCAIIRDVSEYDTPGKRTEYAVLDKSILSNVDEYSLYDD